MATDNNTTDQSFSPQVQRSAVLEFKLVKVSGWTLPGLWPDIRDVAAGGRAAVPVAVSVVHPAVPWGRASCDPPWTHCPSRIPKEKKKSFSSMGSLKVVQNKKVRKVNTCKRKLKYNQVRRKPSLGVPSWTETLQHWLQPRRFPIKQEQA